MAVCSIFPLANSHCHRQHVSFVFWAFIWSVFLVLSHNSVFFPYCRCCRIPFYIFLYNFPLSTLLTKAPEKIEMTKKKKTHTTQTNNLNPVELVPAYGVRCWTFSVFHLHFPDNSPPIWGLLWCLICATALCNEFCFNWCEGKSCYL